MTSRIHGRIPDMTGRIMDIKNGLISVRIFLLLEKTVLFILGTAEIEKESVKVVFNLKKPGISGTVSVL